MLTLTFLAHLTWVCYFGEGRVSLLHISCSLATRAMWKWGWKKRDNCKTGGCPLRKNSVLKIMNESVSSGHCDELLLLQVFDLINLLMLTSSVENCFLAFWCNVYLASHDDAS